MYFSEEALRWLLFMVAIYIIIHCQSTQGHSALSLELHPLSIEPEYSAPGAVSNIPLTLSSVLRWLEYSVPKTALTVLVLETLHTSCEDNTFCPSGQSTKGEDAVPGTEHSGSEAIPGTVNAVPGTVDGVPGMVKAVPGTEHSGHEGRGCCQRDRALWLKGKWMLFQEQRTLALGQWMLY